MFFGRYLVKSAHVACGLIAGFRGVNARKPEKIAKIATSVSRRYYVGIASVDCIGMTPICSIGAIRR